MRRERSTRRVSLQWAGRIAGALVLASVLAAGAATFIDPTPAEADGPAPADSESAAEGYRLFAADGGVFSFGSTSYLGGTGGARINAPIVGMAATPTGEGYWLVGMDGGVFAFGDAQYFGGTGGTPLAEPIASIAATPTGRGYWLVGLDGGVFAFGDAQYFGGTGDRVLNSAVVGMTATPSGNGYWLVAIDGGVFAFGDAQFYGSTSGIRLGQPVVGIARTQSGRGYWLVGLDGGVFAFGDAPFHGALGGVTTNAPIVGIARAGADDGYVLVGLDGGVFTFGPAEFYGGTGGVPLNQPVLGVASRAGGSSGSLFPYFLKVNAKTSRPSVGPWPGPGQVALTFDDGPNPSFTPLILDILARENVPATFFVVGGAAARSPELLQRAQADGHSVQNHTYGHETLSTMSSGAIVDNLTRTSDAIQAAIGTRPTCYRPPSGLTNDRVVSAGASIGLTEVVWTNGTGDWTSGVSAPEMVRQGLAPANGQPLVILMHDGGGAASARESTVAALPSIIAGLRDRGYEFVSLCN